VVARPGAPRGGSALIAKRGTDQDDRSSRNVADQEQSAW
jgi:hypothetical protein